MGRAPCCDETGLKKGPWTAEEDETLASYIRQHGHGSWQALPKKAGLLRCGKSCRWRWTNYLTPDIKRGGLTLLEEQTIIQLHALLGNRWSAIAAHLPKRTDNEIKNHWNTHLKKRLVKMGLDPATHKPKAETFPRPLGSALSNSSLRSSSLAHMAQWESARLEAETRLSRESGLRASGLWPLSSSPQQASPNCDHLISKQYLIDVMAVEQDLGRLTSSSSQERDSHNASRNSHKQQPQSRSRNNFPTSSDLMSSPHNWENSFSGQTGLMRAEGWRLSSRIEAQGLHDSSSCSSTIAHGTTTSTFHSSKLPTPQMPVQAPSAKEVRLSWSDAWVEDPVQSSSSGTAGFMTFKESDGLSNNTGADTDSSKRLPLSVCNRGRSRDSDERQMMNSASSDGLNELDQALSTADTSSVTTDPLVRILITNEYDLDQYWHDLLADSPKEKELRESIVW